MSMDKSAVLYFEIDQLHRTSFIHLQYDQLTLSHLESIPLSNVTNKTTVPVK